MKPLISACRTSCLLICLSVAAGAQTTFVASLDGLQNIPSLPEVTATGTAVLILNNAETEVSYHIEYTGLSSPEIGAHIHNAGPRDIGPIVFVLPWGTPKDGIWQISASDVQRLKARSLYINVHTETYGIGEIRGNLAEQPTPVRATTWGAIKALHQTDG